MWLFIVIFFCCFFFKQKTAYEMRISDWSSDVCSSDLYDCKFVSTQPKGHVAVPHCRAKTGRDDDQHRVARIMAMRIVDLLEPKIGRASCRERVCQYV